jgi:hypothetical protein
MIDMKFYTHTHYSAQLDDLCMSGLRANNKNSNGDGFVDSGSANSSEPATAATTTTATSLTGGAVDIDAGRLAALSLVHVYASGMLPIWAMRRRLGESGVGFCSRSLSFSSFVLSRIRSTLSRTHTCALAN